MAWIYIYGMSKFSPKFWGSFLKSDNLFSTTLRTSLQIEDTPVRHRSTGVEFLPWTGGKTGTPYFAMGTGGGSIATPKEADNFVF